MNQTKQLGYYQWIIFNTQINNPSKILSQIACSIHRRTKARSGQQVFNMENQTILPNDLSLEYGGAYLGLWFRVGKGFFWNELSHAHHKMKYLHPPGQNLIDVTVGLCMMNWSLTPSYVAVVSRPLKNVPVNVQQCYVFKGMFTKWSKLNIIMSVQLKKITVIQV